MRYCGRCGKQVNENSNFCGSCGSELNFNYNQKKQQESNNMCGMTCTRCGSHNVTVQVTNEVYLKKKGKSCAYWIFIGWWLEIILWLFLTLPRLLVALFIPKQQKTINKTVKTAVCQNCGNSWSVK